LTTVNASEILSKIQRGEPVEYQNSTILGDLNLSQVLGLERDHVDRTDYVSNFLLIGEDEENVALVNSTININGSVIDGNVYFSNAKFLKNVKISNTILNEVDFTGSFFNGLADFSGSTFNGPSFFWGSNFSRSVTFEESKFSGPSKFEGVSFDGRATFKGTNFYDSVTFEESSFQYAGFDESKFLGPVNFKHSNFKHLSVPSPIFSGSLFNQSAIFENALFNGTTYFNRCKFNGPVQFTGSIFNNTVEFNYAVFEKRAEFADVIVDSINFKTAKINDTYANWEIAKNFILNNQDKIRMYEKLRKEYQLSGLSDDANDCYYQIRDIRGSMIDDWQYKVLDFVEKCLYGYGMKPLYPLGWSIFLIIMFGFLYRRSGTKNSFYFSYNIFLSGTGKLLVDTPKLPEDCSDSIRILYDFERTLGLLFFSLFLITITKAALA
jgi:uncharacterized protein YjbI with pentapeptide repeats